MIAVEVVSSTSAVMTSTDVLVPRVRRVRRRRRVVVDWQWRYLSATLHTRMRSNVRLDTGGDKTGQDERQRS